MWERRACQYYLVGQVSLRSGQIESGQIELVGILNDKMTKLQKNEGEIR
jgi:hypothetical protein